MLPFADDLRYIFIVSEVELVNDKKLEGAFVSEDVERLSIRVEKASGEKCGRCWVHDTSVGTNSDHPTICNRCKDALAKMP
jgi:isoleucyl-tRNA synthetase